MSEPVTQTAPPPAAMAPPGTADRNGAPPMFLTSRPVAALSSATEPSGQAPSTALTPRLVTSHAPAWSAAIAVAGDRAWVVDVDSSAVTEIDAATGALIRVIPSLPNVPFAIAADRAGAWLVTNLGVKAVDGSRPDGSVAELSAAAGRLVRNIGAPPFRSAVPGGAIAAGGGAVWVTGSDFYGYRHWLAELSAATGALVRVIVG